MTWAPTSLTGVDSGRVLSDADFERLREFFYQRTGIQFSVNKRYFVDKRVLACMEEYAAEDFGTYFAALRLGAEPSVMQRLVNALTVNETYFFREDYQFDALLHQVLPAIVHGMGASRRPIRILSLPCSTGDEAYSIAIRLSESWNDMERYDVEIVGADIDTRALEQARQGIFTSRSVQRLPRSVMERYFSVVDERHFRIDDGLVDAIDYVLANLVDPSSMSRLRNFDIVFCRNLLIYFDEVSSRIAAGNLYDSLRHGGYLFLGHAESMSRITTIFTPRRIGDGIVYQKTG